MSLLQFRFEIRERRDVALRVLGNPSIVNEPDRDGIEEVPLLPSRPANDDEAGAFEDAQVLHHAEARHRQLGLELGERPPIADEEPIEQIATRRIRERLEHAVVVSHTRIICDQMVTCQQARKSGRISADFAVR
jgi:hypothetical protein